MNKKIDLNLSKKIALILFIIIIIYVLNSSSYLNIMNNYNVEGFEFSLKSHFLDFLLYFLIASILFVSTNRLMLSCWLISIFYFILTFASTIKVTYSLSPIYLADISFFNGGASEIISLVSKEAFFYFFKESFKGYFLTFILLALFTYLVHFIDIQIFNKSKRIFVFIISLIFISLLLTPNIFKIFIDYTNKDFETSNLYSKHGLIAGIYGYELSTNINKPENYNEEIVLNVLKNYKSSEKGNDWGTPNLIVVLSEAFVDFSELTDITFNEDIYKDYNDIKNNSTSFKCISPSYGGRTGNIEFEYNTFTSLRYLSEAVIPYNMLYGKNNMENYPSIAKIFNDNSYETNIYSPYDNGDIYKVKYVYDKLGYKNKFFYSDILKQTNKDILIDDRLISDQELIDIVIKNTSKEKTFSFIKTVQNHMPYNVDRYNNEDLDVKIIANNNLNNTYTKNELDYFSVYGQGVYENGKALKKLYNYVQSIETPTIVVFFGDHLPLLSDDSGTDLLKKSEYLNQNNKLNNLYNQYSTNGLIFSNYEIDTSDLPKNISFDTLSAYILKHININKGNFKGYVDYLYDSIDYLPACNKYISINNKELKETYNLNNKSKEFYEKLNFIEYYYLDKNYQK